MCVGDAPLGYGKLCDPSTTGYPNGCYDNPPMIAYSASGCWTGYSIRPTCNLAQVAVWTRQLCVMEMKQTAGGRNMAPGTKFCARAPSGWNAQARSTASQYLIVDTTSPNAGTPF